MPASPRWSGTQRRLGLTGGIASGKSTVARWLEQQGLPVLDADVFAREALAPGSSGAQAVLERYGKAVRAQGTAAGESVIDRAALGRIVFHNREERQWLEQLVHPLVRERFAAELDARSTAEAVVLVIPLLFEAGLEGLCSEVWLVDCDEAQQLQRLMQRDGLNEAAAQARINAQWPLERKRPLADQVIDNRSDAAALHKQLEPLLRPAADATTPQAAPGPASWTDACEGQPFSF
jgi:dephospho-CoA kinase